MGNGCTWHIQLLPPPPPNKKKEKTEIRNLSHPPLKTKFLRKKNSHSPGLTNFPPRRKKVLIITPKISIFYLKKIFLITTRKNYFPNKTISYACLKNTNYFIFCIKVRAVHFRCVLNTALPFPILAS